MAIWICTWLWRTLIALTLLLGAWAKWNAGISYLPPESIYDRIVDFSPWRHYAILTTETIIGLWVLSSLKSRWSAGTASLLLLAFTALLVAEIVRADPAACGCGIRAVRPGDDPRTDLAIGIGRNLILLLGCAWIWLFAREPATPAPGESPGSPAQAEA